MIGLYGAKTAVLHYESMSQITEMLEQGVRQLGLYQFVNFINPIRHEAMKTYAYEISQQLGWRAPDVMIHPVGTGGGIWGAYKGFQELCELGWIDHSPRMAAVQPRATAHFYQAFKEGSKTAGKFGDPTQTIAQSIAADAPIQGGERVLKAVYDSNGFANGVSDEEILEAMRLLGKEGISAEPASAASLAALKRAVQNGQVHPHETVVCIITGSGLKQPSAVQMASSEIDLKLNANISELAHLVESLWH
jgi:threonine synthase